MVSIIDMDPDILGGTPVIKGTRIPASIIFEMAGLGYSVDQIVEFYPDLSRDTVMRVLRLGKELVDSLTSMDINKYLEEELVHG